MIIIQSNAKHFFQYEDSLNWAWGTGGWLTNMVWITTECKIMPFLQGQYMPQHNDLKVLFLTKEDYTIWNVLGNKDIGII